jgi:acyl-CoA synthetase (AMP-forming)/AMP-acid ligase II
MRTGNVLHHVLLDATRLFPDRLAVEEPGHGTVTYQELATLSDRLRDRLAALGVRAGDRVGLYMRKSIDAVASIFGILKSGAAYVRSTRGTSGPECVHLEQLCRASGHRGRAV